jgi:hypothetical protein
MYASISFHVAINQSHRCQAAKVAQCLSVRSTCVLATSVAVKNVAECSRSSFAASNTADEAFDLSARRQHSYRGALVNAGARLMGCSYLWGVIKTAQH